jgi:hypothetical protein
MRRIEIKESRLTHFNALCPAFVYSSLRARGYTHYTFNYVQELIVFIYKS